MNLKTIASSAILLPLVFLTGCTEDEVASVDYSGSSQQASIVNVDMADSYLQIYLEASNIIPRLDDLLYLDSYGTCGGSTYTSDYSYESIVDLEMTAYDFCEYDTFDNKFKIDGFLNLTYDYYRPEKSFTAKGFSIDYPAYGINTTIDGSIQENDIDLYSPELVIKDKDTNQTYMIREWLERYDEDDNLMLAGKIYHPTHGYITVTTNENLTLSDYYKYPLAGQLLFQGNQSSANISFSTNNYYIELDVNGDDIVDYTATYYY